MSQIDQMLKLGSNGVLFLDTHRVTVFDMSYVPIGWNWLIVLGLNVLTFVTVSLIITIPTFFIVRINPILKPPPDPSQRGKYAWEKV